MKEIRAVIRPTRLDRLRQALRELPGFPGFTVLHAEGFAAPADSGRPRSMAEELTDFTPKLLVCILAEASMVQRIEAIILEQCSSGHVGDGLMWTVEAESARHIRDGTPL